MNPFTRRTRVAYFRSGSTWPVFVITKWDGRRLSITGVEGPKGDGDTIGACGQVMLGHEHHTNRIPEYDQLAEVWDRWHLNDMRPGCEHQRAEKWGEETLEVVSYKLTSEAWALKRAAEAEAMRAGKAGEVANLDATGRALLGSKVLLSRYTPPDADSPLSGCYEVEKRENKRASWVRQDEHPRGVLSKPCPTCGYKYGSAWLFEEVPEDVLLFLAGLSDDSDKMPAAWRCE